MNIGIIGTGAYAIALSRLLDKDCNITMWTKFEDEKTSLNITRQNPHALPNYKVKDSIIITSDLKSCVINKELIILAIPSNFLNSIYPEIKQFINSKQIICLASKGFNNDGFNSDTLKKHFNNDIVIISGPTFAIDIVKNNKVGLTVACDSIEAKNIINKCFSSPNLKLQYTDDIKGTELCGGIKNIYAIGMGILDGLNVPISTKALYLTKCIKEIENILEQEFCNKNTILTLAGIGDLYLTCSSTNSRNNTFGTMIARNEDYKSYLKNNTVEGVHALNLVYNNIIKDKTNSIVSIIYSIIYDNVNPNTLIENL